MFTHLWRRLLWLEVVPCAIKVLLVVQEMSVSNMKDTKMTQDWNDYRGQADRLTDTQDVQESAHPPAISRQMIEKCNYIANKMNNEKQTQSVIAETELSTPGIFKEVKTLLSTLITRWCHRLPPTRPWWEATCLQNNCYSHKVWWRFANNCQPISKYRQKLQKMFYKNPTIMYICTFNSSTEYWTAAL